MYMESKRKKKRYWWAYLQRRNGDTDVENGLDTVGEGESSINIYTLSMDKMDSWGKVAE